MKKLSLIIGLLLWGGCPFWAQAYDNDYTHPLLAEKTVELWNGKTTRPISETEKAWIMEGASEEDVPDWRSINHFYNPLTEESLTVAGIAIGSPSPEWGAGDVFQDPNIYQANYSYANAVHLLAQGESKRAFVALGASLHILADAGLPAHVRNDEHLEGDPYESWVKTMASKSDSKLWSNLSLAKLKTCSNYADCVKKMALDTNYNYFSRDSIYFFTEPLARAKACANRSDYLCDNQRLLAKKNNFGFYYLDDDVHYSYWQELAPKIIGYGSNIIQHFFEDVALAKTTQPTKTIRLAGGEKIWLEGFTPPVIDESINIPANFLRQDNLTDNLANFQPILETIRQTASTTPEIIIAPPAVSTSTVSTTTTEVVTGDTDNQATDITNGSTGGGSASTTTSTVNIVTETPDVTTSTIDIATSTTDLSTSTPEVTGYSNISDQLKDLWHFDTTDAASGHNEISGQPQLDIYSGLGLGRWGDGLLIAGERLSQGAGTMFFDGQQLTSAEVSMAFSVNYTNGSIIIALTGGDLVKYALTPSNGSLTLLHNHNGNLLGRGESLATVLPNDGLWHQVVVVLKANQLELYIDGELQETVTNNFSYTPSINNIYLVPQFGAISVDEIALWERALSAEEIAAWAQSDLPLQP